MWFDYIDSNVKVGDPVYILRNDWRECLNEFGRFDEIETGTIESLKYEEIHGSFNTQIWVYARTEQGVLRDNNPWDSTSRCIFTPNQFKSKLINFILNCDEEIEKLKVAKEKSFEVLRSIGE